MGNQKEQETTKDARGASELTRMVRRTKNRLPKINFINYRKEFNGKYPITGWKPRFTKYFSGDLWHFGWRGFAIQLDFRGEFTLIDILTDSEKAGFFKRLHLWLRRN